MNIVTGASALYLITYGNIIGEKHLEVSMILWVYGYYTAYETGFRVGCTILSKYLISGYLREIILIFFKWEGHQKTYQNYFIPLEYLWNNLFL